MATKYIAGRLVETVPLRKRIRTPKKRKGKPGERVTFTRNGRRWEATIGADGETLVGKHEIGK